MALGAVENARDGADASRARTAHGRGTRKWGHCHRTSLAHRVWNDGRVSSTFRIECWSDVTCPFCYLGKRRLDLALARFPHGDECVVVPRAFELDPHARPRYSQPLVELLAHKYGMPLDRAAAFHRQLEHQAAELHMTWSMEACQPSHSFDAHRLVAHAATAGRASETLERLFAAYFSEGRLLSDHHTLVELGDEVGLTGVEAMLASDDHTDEVRRDEAEAEERGVAGVPHLLIDGRFAVAGAREVDELVDVLERAWRRRNLQDAATVS
jgi:predicted DsbA family dithiol-disulfide isomerase